VTRRVKYRASIVVEGRDRAAIERGDPSIPADELKAAQQVVALLKVIEEWFPESKSRYVELDDHSTIRMSESEIALNRIQLARDFRGDDLGAWAPKNTLSAIEKFEMDFEKAVMSWRKIPGPLRGFYDSLARDDTRVPGDRLDEILLRLDAFVAAATPAVREAVSNTTATGSDRVRWSAVMVVDACRQVWIEQRQSEPPSVAQAQMEWAHFLQEVFEAMQMDATPERATKAWKANRAQIEATLA
jgi:hypothetical protein